MSKADIFAELDSNSDFSARSPIVYFERETDPKSLGKTRMSQAAQIEITQIIAKDQVRKEYDPAKHQELVASLKEHGQQQPIRVYWSDPDEKWVVLMGHRRLRAAKDAGFDKIDCITQLTPPSEGDVVELQLIENIIRQELNAVEEAEAFQKIMEARNCTAKDVAKLIGRDPTTVQRSVRLLTLPADILADVAAGKIPKSVIKHVFTIKGENAENERRQVIVDYKNGQSFTQTTKVIAAKKSGKSAKTSAGTKKVYTSGGVKIQVTSKKRLTKSEIAEVLQQYLEELQSDGRSNKAAA